LGGQRVIKEFGLGLAAGILMDALVIRMAIVPSLMFLFGKANWWFPAWLDRVLPRISVDPDVPAPGGRPDGPTPTAEGDGPTPGGSPDGPTPTAEPEKMPV
ncbi:MAG TPA: hypothetical protein VFC03_12885, partial [Acidimicrobiales bacterium]|nr:hypothetical protein [Acidimicrobiales bacterium]